MSASSGHGAPTARLEVPEEVHRRRWLILVALCLSMTLIVMDNTVLNVALPTLVRDLGATTSQLQWIVDSYTLVFAGLLLTFGALGDRFGRKKALVGGMGIFAVGSVLAATIAHSAFQLTLLRAVMGAGGALIMPATLSILTNVFADPLERARAISVWAAASGIGVVIGPATGGWLLQHYSWESVFWLNVPVIAIAVIAALRIIPESKDPDAPRLDLVGAVSSTFGLIALVWAIIEAPGKGWTSVEVLGGFTIAIVVLAVFIGWELHTAEPMLDMRFFKNRRFSAANGAITLSFFAMFGSMFMVTQYLQFVMGYSPMQAGLRLIPWALVMMVLAPISPLAVKKFGSKVVVASGLAIVAVGLYSLSTIEVATSYPMLLLRFAVLAAGMSFVMPPATESVMGSLPPEKAGVGSALNDTTRELGGAFGVAIIGSLVSSAYTSGFARAIGDKLSGPALDRASGSLGAALAVAQQSGEAGGAIVSAAKSSFVDALSSGMGVAALVVLFAAGLTMIFLPGRAHEAPMETVNRDDDNLALAYHGD
ncbi:MAG: MFS transporter [Acidimicrobiia bacterium]